MNVGTLTISLTARTASLAKAAAQVKAFEGGVIASVQRINASIATVGMAFSALTIPIAAIGIGATKMFAEFEFSLAKVEGLVGIAHDQTMQWGASILELTKTIGRSAGEMGDALYFVSSGGVRSANTMKIVKMAAQGAAAGMGETKIIANLATNVMNAYGEANISVAETFDILTTAIREGQVEASDLPTALGKILPVSSAMGVSFNEVGAAVAALTRTGTKATTAGMMIRRMLMAIQKPAEGASNALEEFGGTSGITFQQLRDIAGNEKGGLIKAMLKIKDIADDVGWDKIAYLIPNLRAYLPTLDILGKNLEKNKGIWMSMLEPTGNFKLMLETVADTFQYKFAVAVNAAGQAFIQFGHTIAQTLLPVINDFAQKMRDLSDWWTSLPRDIQLLITKITLLTGVLGPLLILFSALVGVLVTVASTLVSLAGSVFGLAVAIFLVTQNTKEWKQLLERKISDVMLKDYQVQIEKTQDMFTKFGQAYQSVEGGRSESVQKMFENLANESFILQKLMKDFDAAPDLKQREKIYKQMAITSEKAIQLQKDLIKQAQEDELVFSPGKGGPFNLVPIVGDASYEVLNINIEKLRNLRKQVLQLLNEQRTREDLTFGDAFIGSLENIKNKMEPITNQMREMLKDIFNIDGDAAGSFPASGIVDKTNALNEFIEGVRAADREFQSFTDFERLINTDMLKMSGGVFGQLIEQMEIDEAKLFGISHKLGKDFDFIGKRIKLYNDVIKEIEKLELNYSPEEIAKMKELLNIVNPEGVLDIRGQMQGDLDMIAEQSEYLGNTFLASEAKLRILRRTLSQFTNLTKEAWANMSESMRKEWGKTIEKIGEDAKKLTNTLKINDIVASSMTNMVETIGKGFADAENAYKAFGNSILSMGQQIVGMLLKEAFATILLGGAAKGLPGLIAAAIGIGFLQSMWSKSTSTIDSMAKMTKGGTIPSGYPNDSYPAWLSSGEKVLPAPISLNSNFERDPVYAQLPPGGWVIRGRDLLYIVEDEGRRRSNSYM